jgi:hypothetical protein
VNVQFRLDVDPTAGDVSASGQVIQDVDNLSETGGSSGTWEERRITFTPADLGFGAGTYNFYLGSKNGVQNTWAFVDGLVVNKTADLCEPAPTTTTTEAPPTSEPTPTTVGECTSSPTTDRSLIPNGDFNLGYVDAANPGQPGVAARRAFAPPPWGINSTPDYSTANNISFNADGGTPRAQLPGFDLSPTGGSFMGFRTISSGGEEGIYNTLQINDPTEEMTIVFDYTEYTGGVSSLPPVDPGVNVQFRLNVDPTALDVSSTGTLISDVDNLSETGGTSGTWEQRRITFVPADLGFTTPGAYNFYLGSKNGVQDTWAFVDGLVVNLTKEICPEQPPTTLPT